MSIRICGKLAKLTSRDQEDLSVISPEGYDWSDDFMAIGELGCLPLARGGVHIDGWTGVCYMTEETYLWWRDACRMQQRIHDAERVMDDVDYDRLRSRMVPYEMEDSLIAQCRYLDNARRRLAKKYGVRL